MNTQRIDLARKLDFERIVIEQQIDQEIDNIRGIV